MKERKQPYQNIEYIVEYAGLPTGEHLFEFDIDNAFIQQYHNEPLENTYSVKVKVLLLKQNHSIKANIYIKGTLSVFCDKCLIPFLYPFEIETTLLIEKGNPENSTDEVLMVEPNSNKINLSQYLYETISLSIPQKIVPCELFDNVQCDKEILKKLTDHLPEQNKITTFAELFKNKFK